MSNFSIISRKVIVAQELTGVAGAVNFSARVFAVVNDDTGETVGEYGTREEAEKVVRGFVPGQLTEKMRMTTRREIWRAIDGLGERGAKTGAAVGGVIAALKSAVEMVG